MEIGNRDLITRLLKQSILSLCREMVTRSRRLEVDGIICLTVDDQDQHVVKIHEFFDRPNDSKKENVQARSSPNETTYQAEFTTNENVRDSCKISSSTREEVEKNISQMINLEANNISIKPDPDADMNNYSDVKEENDSMKGLSMQEPKSLTQTRTSSSINDKAENNISHQNKSKSDNIQTKSNLNTDNYSEVKGKTDNMKGISLQDPQSNTQTSSGNLTYVDYKDIDVKSSATNILCKKCNSTLKNVDIFQAHNMALHNHYTCIVCLATFTTPSNLKRHFGLHTGVKPFTCQKCPKGFNRYDDFKRHLLKHTFQKTFRCALCKMGCSNKAVVKSHMLKQHNSKVYHVCPQCGDSYIDFTRFQQHKKIHSQFQDYRCSICSFTGSNALMYNKHMLTHGPLKEYKCTHCTLSFSDPFMYTSHMKEHKGDEQVQNYNCCFCNKTFQTFEKFQKHEHTHNKQFINSSNLRENSNEMGYSNKANLKSHMMKQQHNLKVHHVCPQCGDRFIDLTRFQQHKKMHSNFQNYHCMICSFEGSNALMYNKHMLTHGPPKEYKCIHCNTTFTDPFMYTLHMKGHKDDGHVHNYNCCFCNKTFQSFEKFQKHEHTHVRSMTHLSKTAVQNARNSLSPSEYVDNNHLQNDAEMRLRKTMKDENFRNDSHKMKTNEENGNKTNKEHVKSLTSTNNSMIKSPDKNDNSVNRNQRKTQMKNVYEDSTQTGSKNNHVYNEDTVADNRKTYNPFEDSTQNEGPYFSVYKEETVTVNTNSHKDSVSKNGKTETPQNTPKINMKQNLNDVSDAMRQVKDIQSRFGIKSVKSDTLKAVNQLEQERKRPFDDDCIIVTSNKLLKPSTPVKKVSGGMSKMTELQNPRSKNGTNTKIHGTPYISSLGQTDTESFRSSKDSRNIEEEDHVNEYVLPKKKTYTDISEQINSDNKLSARSPSETLNLKASNEGFQAAVKPNHFICSYCYKVLSSQSNMERHIRIHIGEKLYTCELCHECFLREDDLKNHRAYIHTDTNIEPIKCGACQASFSLPQDLEKHLQIHPDHKL